MAGQCEREDYAQEVQQGLSGLRFQCLRVLTDPQTVPTPVRPAPDSRFKGRIAGAFSGKKQPGRSWKNAFRAFVFCRRLMLCGASRGEEPGRRRYLCVLLFAGNVPDCPD